jgi:hypothetical protein
MGEDWRLRIEIGDKRAHGLLERLRILDTDAEELARELKDQRLAVTRDDDTVFVYASSAEQLERATSVIAAELTTLGIEPKQKVREHWLTDEDRWDDEPPGLSVDEETVAGGHAPWEVRIPCKSHHAARELADQLEAEGYGVVRRWSFVIAGTTTREEADELAGRVHGEVEAGGELVWETAPGNPFAIFGGLGGTGTPF